MPTMATAHLVRVAVVILCWETFATAHVTKYTVEYHKYPVEVQLDETRQMAMVTPPDTAGFLKYKTLHDYNTKITAYKDLEKSLCYLERIKDTDGRIKHQMRQFRPQRQSYRMRDKPRTMYVSDKNLSKYEVWRVAGSRISSFCRDFPATLLQEMRPQFRKGIVNNELPDQEELQVLEPQTGDAFLQQVKGRRKRQTYTTRGYSRRHRGQTQTQYLAFQNGGNEGKAEAESSPDLSRTHVSGTNGMGQAQSQSGQGNGCEGCFPGGYGYGTQPGQFDYVPGAPQPVYQQPVRVPGAPSEVPRAPGVGVLTGVPGIQIPDGVPRIGVPSVGVPSIGVPGAQIPGVGVPGARLPTAQIPDFGVPGVGVPRIGVPTVQIPGAGLPAAQIPGFGIPGVGAPGVGVPTVQIPGVGAPGVPGPQIPGFGAPGVGGPGAQIPGVGTPGVPGPQIPVFGVSGVGAPGAQIPGVGAPGAQIPGVGAPGPQIPGFGIPGVGVPVGTPSTQIQGVGVPGIGAPTAQISGVGVPGIHIPGAGLPGPPVTGIYQQPTGVSGVGIPVQLGIYHPSLGVPGGVTGVAPPGIITYQPGLYQQPGIRTPTQVGYPGEIYQQLGGGTVTQPGYVQPGGLGQVGGVYTGQDAYQTVGYTAAGDSQAESNVKQEDNETRAAASAQGKYGGGTAQTQVSGIYSGTGAFSAQAQTSDKDRGAQSQVIGGKEGASSTAQGQAGNGKTQSQVQLGSSSGATTAEAQSGGVYYGTNTQVQAGSQGGMADAQAKGQGSTSSQAQIGFTPYQKDRKTNGQKSPFHGGGSASAQSGAYSGQSQSQIQGSFLHGISYTGGAQAGSGQTSYSRTASSNYENFGGKLGLVQSGSRNGIPQNGRTSISNGQQSGYQQFGSLNNSPSSHVLSEQRTHEDGSAGQEVVTSPHHSDHMRDYNDETTRQPDAYTGTETGSQHGQTSNFGIPRNENGRAQQGGYRIQTYDATVNDTRHTGVPTQTQHIVLGPLNGRGAHVIQDVDDQDQYNPGDILQPGQTIHGTPEYTIPKGYRGRITSVASPQKTAAQGGQSQTVVVTPGVGNVTHTNPSAESYQPSVMSIPIGQQSVERSYDQSSQSGHAGTENTQLRNGGQQSFSVRRNGGYSHRNGRTSRNGNHIRNGHSLNSYNQPTPDSFVTVTKSVTGQLDNGKSSSGTGKFTHTYYTKSSTCGYFTFSCNIVFGSNGRTKICKPNPPTNPDGTPCCC